MKAGRPGVLRECDESDNREETNSDGATCKKTRANSRNHDQPSAIRVPRVGDVFRKSKADDGDNRASDHQETRCEKSEDAKDLIREPPLLEAIPVELIC
jgi:hypothetical protein